MEEATPIACDLSALDEDSRREHEQVAEHLLRSVVEACEEDQGYAFRLPADTQTISAAGQFIARERLCCPFFDFALEIPREYGSVWLRLSGREGVKPYIAANVLPLLENAKTP